jgi:hypothetical protein
MSRGGPLSFHLVTVDEMLKIQARLPKDGSRHSTREELEKMARNDSTCENCDLPVWRFGETGMCFTCTTGESDASDDYELVLIK